MSLLLLHGSGFEWDEAVAALGALAALTGFLVVGLRGREPAAEEAQPEQPRPTQAPPKKPGRRQ
jgi:hypothetical protein